MSMEKQEEDVEPCEKGQEVVWTWWHALVVSLPPGGMLGDSGSRRDQSQGSRRDQSQGAGAGGARPAKKGQRKEIWRKESRADYRCPWSKFGPKPHVGAEATGY